MSTDQEECLVTVPSICRPRLGPNAVSFEDACQRGELAMQACNGSADYKMEIFAKLVDLGKDSGGYYDGPDLQRVLKGANDARGMAAMSSTDLSAEIADTIFSIAERAQNGGKLSRDLVTLLARTSLRVFRYSPESDGGELAARIQLLLAGVRAKAACG